jgi:hypothetical protein
MERKHQGAQYSPAWALLRAAFLGDLAMLGKNLLWVAKQHGHSVEVMLRMYAAWLEGATESDIHAIKQAMEGRPYARASIPDARAAICAVNAGTNHAKLIVIRPPKSPEFGSSLAERLAYAERVIMVPGYGLAVSQAQHQIRELGDLIEKRGGDVRYAIHPVAGRMPGHMNVLLAAAGVPYDKLIDMDEINERFVETDVAIVVGANDVVNPAARTNPASPIFGIPILKVTDAKSVLVLKRGKGKGFSGVENDLFVDPKTAMLFGEARQSLLGEYILHPSTRFST